LELATIFPSRRNRVFWGLMAREGTGVGKGLGDWTIGRLDDFRFSIFDFRFNFRFRVWDFGFWDLFGVWCLVLGICLVLGAWDLDFSCKQGAFP
jgi:hypothetical protein